MTVAYLHEWASQLCARYPQLGAAYDLSGMRAGELSALVVFLESYDQTMRALIA